MAWRPPAYLFGPNPSDSAMMEEVLELLATDSPSSGDDRTASTTASSCRSNNDNGDDNNHSSLAGTSGRGSVESMQKVEARSEETSCVNAHCGEQRGAPGRRAVQGQEQGAEAVLGLGIPIPSSIHATSPSQPWPQAGPGGATMSLPLAQSSKYLGQWPSRRMQHDAAPFAGNAGLIASASTLDRQNCPPSVVQPPVAPPTRPTQQHPRESAATSRRETRTASESTTSRVLSNGQRVHVMNSAEFDELRRKLRMQTASRRYRKRKKDKARQQKLKIQELQSELARLQQLEAQSQNYQKRSPESLDGELRIHEEEIADLSTKIQDAAKEEVEWVHLMSSHMRK